MARRKVKEEEKMISEIETNQVSDKTLEQKNTMENKEIEALRKLALDDAIKEIVENLPENVSKGENYNAIVKMIAEAKMEKYLAEFNWKESQKALTTLQKTAQTSTRVLNPQEIEELLLGSINSGDLPKEKVLEQGKKMLFAYLWLTESQTDESGETTLTKKQSEIAEEYLNSLMLNPEIFEKHFWKAIKKCFSFINTKKFTKRKRATTKLAEDSENNLDDNDTDMEEEMEDSTHPLPIEGNESAEQPSYFDKLRKEGVPEGVY